MPTSNHRCPSPFVAVPGVTTAVIGLLLAGVLSGPASAAEKRKLTSIEDFNQCVDAYQAPPEACLDLLHAYIKSKPSETFAAGKAVRARMNHADAVPFFAKAFARQGDKNRCADRDVAMAVAAGLDMSPSPTVTEALAITFDKCWTELEKPVLKALTASGSSGYMAQNLCPKLAARKVANPACEKMTAATAPVEPKWKDADPKTMSADGPAKVFKGDEGRTLTLVKLKSPDEYLIRFDGFRGEWNGRIVFHREAPANAGYDYVTQVKGARWVGVVVRDGNTEAHPVGDNGPFRVAYDESASKATSPQALVDQFRKQK
ncbi:MAG TPA: hypothetical protein VIU64_08920 [Polyangia bacterium]